MDREAKFFCFQGIHRFRRVAILMIVAAHGYRLWKFRADLAKRRSKDGGLLVLIEMSQ